MFHSIVSFNSVSGIHSLPVQAYSYPSASAGRCSELVLVHVQDVQAAAALCSGMVTAGSCQTMALPDLTTNRGDLQNNTIEVCIRTRIYITDTVRAPSLYSCTTWRIGGLEGLTGDFFHENQSDHKHTQGVHPAEWNTYHGTSSSTGICRALLE